MLHPAETPKVPYVTQTLGDAPGVYVAASDYLKALPDAIDRWLPRRLVSLGTDGFGRSESRADLRNHFEVDARFVVVGDAVGAGAREADRREGRAAGDRRSRDQRREGESGDCVAGQGQGPGQWARRPSRASIRGRTRG